MLLFRDLLRTSDAALRAELHRPAAMRCTRQNCWRVQMTRASFIKVGVQFFAEKLKFNFFEKLDTNFVKICVSTLQKRGSDISRGFCSMSIW